MLKDIFHCQEAPKKILGFPVYKKIPRRRKWTCESYQLILWTCINLSSKSHSRIHFKRSTTSLTFKSLSKYNRLWYLSYLKNPIEIISFLKAVQVKIKYNKSLLNKPNNSKKNLCHKKWVTLNSSKVSLKCMLWCNGIGFFVWNLFWDKKFNLPSTDCNRSRGTHCVCGEIIWTVALNLFHP